MTDNTIYRPDVDRVFTALVRYGLRMKGSDLSLKEIHRQRTIIEDLLSENSAEILIHAIQYGMPRVWPFSEDGRAFAASDLENNLLKAKAEAAKSRRAGEIAYRPGG